MDPTIQFTHLKIILLQCFQFSVFSNNKLNQNGQGVYFWSFFSESMEFFLLCSKPLGWLGKLGPAISASQPNVLLFFLLKNNHNN